MYGNSDEVQLPMDFQIADVNRALRAALPRAIQPDREQLRTWAAGVLLFSNHDQPRQWDRYGDGEHNDQIAKLMAVLELTTRGTPQMYYGEELGMRTTDPARIEDVHDPIGKLGWPKEKGRDGERTPMQWDSAAGADLHCSQTLAALPPRLRPITWKPKARTRTRSSTPTNGSWRCARQNPPFAMDAGEPRERPHVFAFLRRSRRSTVRGAEHE